MKLKNNVSLSLSFLTVQFQWLAQSSLSEIMASSNPQSRNCTNSGSELGVKASLQCLGRLEGLEALPDWENGQLWTSQRPPLPVLNSPHGSLLRARGSSFVCTKAERLLTWWGWTPVLREDPQPHSVHGLQLLWLWGTALCKIGEKCFILWEPDRLENQREWQLTWAKTSYLWMSGDSLKKGSGDEWEFPIPQEKTTGFDYRTELRVGPGERV